MRGYTNNFFVWFAQLGLVSFVQCDKELDKHIAVQSFNHKEAVRIINLDWRRIL